MSSKGPLGRTLLKNNLIFRLQFFFLTNDEEVCYLLRDFISQYIIPEKYESVGSSHYHMYPICTFFLGGIQKIHNK